MYQHKFKVGQLVYPLVTADMVKRSAIVLDLPQFREIGIIVKSHFAPRNKIKYYTVYFFYENDSFQYEEQEIDAIL